MKFTAERKTLDQSTYLIFLRPATPFPLREYHLVQVPWSEYFVTGNGALWSRFRRVTHTKTALMKFIKERRKKWRQFKHLSSPHQRRCRAWRVWHQGNCTGTIKKKSRQNLFLLEWDYTVSRGDVKVTAVVFWFLTTSFFRHLTVILQREDAQNIKWLANFLHGHQTNLTVTYFKCCARFSLLFNRHCNTFYSWMIIVT